MKRVLLSIILVLILSGLAAGADESPLAPLKTDSPRDTMRTYITAMNDYRKGLLIDDKQLQQRLEDAIRCFNLEGVPVMTREQTGRDAAIMLKEVIDRIIVIDYNKIPETGEDPEEPLLRWRLKGTEIVISRVGSGDRAGEYLFSPETALRAESFFEKVKNLPYLPGSGMGAGFQEPWIKQFVPLWAMDKFVGLAIWQWGGIFFAILIGLTMRLIARYLVRMGKRLASRTAGEWDDLIVEALSGPTGLLAATGIWFAALYLLKIKGLALTILMVVLEILLFACLTWLCYRLVGVLAEFLRTKAAKTDDKLDDQLVKLVTRSLEVFIIVFGVLLAAQNLGIDVFSLLAGLGIGGLAVALAAKDSLANFFGSIMIMLDRPFQVGHWIVAGGAEGTVEDIGFRSTKIRTFYNSVISVPNSEIAMANIDNMGLRNYRRVYTKVGLTYDTPPEKIEAFLEGCKNIIFANPHTRKDYFHVVFNDFGDSGLVVMLYFFLSVPDWSEELVQRQNVFLEIIRLAKALEVDFAFPTQTVHVETLPEATPAKKSREIDKTVLAETAASFAKDGTDARPSGSGLFVPPYKDKG